MLFYSFLFYLDRQHILTKSNSTDNSFEIIVTYRDACFFGPQEINVYYKKKHALFKNLLFTTYLGNDGKTPNGDSCEIVWNSNNAKVIFSGEEQENESYKVFYNDEKEISSELIESD